MKMTIGDGMQYRLAVCLSGLLFFASNVIAQQDPGPRGGPAAAGGPFSGLSATEQQNFVQARTVFQEVESVSGTIPGESGAGLGPAFNGNSCAMCHSQPAVGGTSPGLKSPQNPVPNPQVALATLDGATNVVPSFITSDGPVREPRYISSATSFVAPNDGSVHEIYTIQGRTDAPGCVMPQPDFTAELAAYNVIFRIPTPLFGLGLVENTPDGTLHANLQATKAARDSLGILGEFNINGNDQTISRFGWKAQNKSLEIFAGEAYNIEMGVTDELFQNERVPVGMGDVPLSCIFNPTPEDATDLTSFPPGPSDVTTFGIFMRLSAPPEPARLSPSAQRGQTVFGTIGCNLCHSPSLTTAASPFGGMSNVTYHPYSDFALHHMGANLTDGILQGTADADEFRTAPLWGVGQRLFFLHDGRTDDLLEAIKAHSSPPGPCASMRDTAHFEVYGVAHDPVFFQQFCNGSEANGVIENFNQLCPDDQQSLLDFLRSL